MKKIALALAVLFCSVSFSFGSGNVPADVKIVTTKLNKIFSNYYNSILKAQNARQFASAMNRYTDDFSKLLPELKAIEKKYKGKNIPDVEYSFEDFQKECAGVMSDEKLEQAYSKHAKYYSDPEVQKAMNRMMQVMQQFDTEDEE